MANHSKPRVGAANTKSVPPDIMAQLEAGTLETATLSEGLAMRMEVLLARVAPKVDLSAFDASAGVVVRMAQAGALLSKPQLAALAGHTSDTVRGWVAFAYGRDESLSADARLALIRPLAADPHFGVREWAWMAIRPTIVAQTQWAIAALTPWAQDPDPNIRRFASEATRPRGVWAASIPLLRREPAHALPLLTPLRHDTTRYVEDSVANWLNDAGKDQPDWVRGVLAEWQAEGVAERLIKRAGRNL
jgi:3-methyladenine DNA glycosylase AlkC